MSYVKCIRDVVLSLGFEGFVKSLGLKILAIISFVMCIGLVDWFDGCPTLSDVRS